MTVTLEPLTLDSLKSLCVAELEKRILSGEMAIGERMPSERDLAAMLKISRPVVHDALSELAAKGILEVRPRRGTFVADFHNNASFSILPSLLRFYEGDLRKDYFSSLLEMRMLIECECARVAASCRKKEHLERLQKYLDQEKTLDLDDIQALSQTDFEFHLLCALASGNVLYPMIINSFKPIYTSITSRFYAKHRHDTVIAEVFNFHLNLVTAIQNRKTEEARKIMEEMLTHGAINL
ncbi:MAG: FadR/GntR family transcriptional regulator [Anaerolineaceae bacterium]|nr:FadR/GntR family transcriptional regulator [Anaerolineaceae bacterium]